MHTGLSPETMPLHELGLDYKQFIREFEKYRSIHPEQSVQQALDTLLDVQDDTSRLLEPALP